MKDELMDRATVKVIFQLKTEIAGNVICGCVTIAQNQYQNYF